MTVNLERNSNWVSRIESRKAWMSVRDADLLETIILRMADFKSGDPIRVVEWGGGRSTLWYTGLLDYFEVPYRWLCLESNRDYFDSEIKKLLLKRPDTKVFYPGESNLVQDEVMRLQQGVIAMVFDHGLVMPYESGLQSDRAINMDHYVTCPRKIGFKCDLAIVDGRKRRRCIIEAGDLLEPGGIAMLHDAWREYYAGCFNNFRRSMRVGDEWEVGIVDDIDLGDYLPSHAFPSDP